MMAAAAFVIAVAGLAIGMLALLVAADTRRRSDNHGLELAGHLLEHSKHEYRIPTNGKADHA